MTEQTTTFATVDPPRGLPNGRYSGYCGVSGHADAGMELVVTVA